jgi:murein DD-endopeptidase MepM/ murein hydrolase activator NlpD
VLALTLAMGLVVAGVTLRGLAPRQSTSALAPTTPAPSPATVPPAAPEGAPATPRTATVDLRKGDSLVSALVREGVESRLAQNLATALRGAGARLERLKPGSAIEITRSTVGALLEARLSASPWLAFVASATGGGWAVRRTETRPEIRVAAVGGEVVTSLFQAVEDAGESARLVIELAEIFASEMDFTAATRAGDRFRLLVEKRYAGDTFVDYGRLLAAQYVGDGRLLTGVGFEGGPRGRFVYYDLDGRSLKKSFLKSPLEFTRITSGFTYARPHPILGGLRPHLAIDYAAPSGTPVRAVADARVLSAGWDGGYGISVRLQHPSGYETMYNHLERLAAGIRIGTRVRQRQVIGYVGATGLATGPHLDYRVSRHGQFVNPLSERFIPGEPIPERVRPDFQAQARSLVHRLESEARF